MSIKTHRGKLVVDLRHPATGERIRVRVPAGEQSPRRAAAFERRVLATMLAGEDPRRRQPTRGATKPVPTLAAFFPDFIAFQGSSANKRPNRPRTLRELQRTFDLYIAPTLGSTRVDAVTTQVVDQLAAQLAARGLGRATIGNALGALRRVLNVAKRWGHVDELPQIDASKPKPDALDPNDWLTLAEADRLVAHAGHWRRVVLLAIRTGLRIGELQALRWRDVDLDARRVHVRRSWSEHAGEFGPPKSGRARELPLAPDAAAALGLPGDPDELLFASANGRPLNPTCLARGLRRAATRAKLGKHVHPHMLRHSFASHCVAAGIPTRVVMSWGGWESEAMLARYAHLAPDAIDHWADRMPGTSVSPVSGPSEKPRPAGARRGLAVGATGLEPIPRGRQK
jgi:integrase